MVPRSKYIVGRDRRVQHVPRRTPPTRFTMSDDVDEGGTNGPSSGGHIPPDVFSRIRHFNTLAMDSIGSLFSALQSSLGGSTDFDSISYNRNLRDSRYDSKMTQKLHGLEEEEEQNTQFRSQDCYDVCNIKTLTAEASQIPL